MRLVCAFTVVLLGCSDQGVGVPVLDDARAETLGDSAIDDVASCTPGETMCGGRCVNVRDDLLNCGRCGAMCASTDTCNGGLCVPAPSLQ